LSIEIKDEEPSHDFEIVEDPFVAKEDFLETEPKTAARLS
jgi:hypothetical protein